MTKFLAELLSHDIIVPEALLLGEDLQLIKGDSGFFIRSIYVSPTGQLIFRLDQASGPLAKNSLANFCSELRHWTKRDIDNLALQCSYRATGTAMLLIDMMVRDKLLSFKDKDYFYSGIRKCLQKQTFILILSDGSVLSGEEFVSSVSA